MPSMTLENSACAASTVPALKGPNSPEMRSQMTWSCSRGAMPSSAILSTEAATAGGISTLEGARG
jgi:hypothetical protein